MRTRSLTRRETLLELARAGMLERYRKKIDWHGIGESLLLDVGTGVKGTVTVDGVTRDNLLLANFGAFWFGILMNADVGPAIDFGGSSYTLRTSAWVISEAFNVYIGTGTTPPSMTDYSLANWASLSTSRFLGNLDTETQIVGTAAADRTFSEVGILQKLCDTSVTPRLFLLARSLMSGGSGTPIVYRIRFQYPWVRNMAYIMYCLMINSEAPVTDIGGTSFPVSARRDVNAGAMYIAGSSQQLSWDIGAYNIPSPFSISTSLNLFNPRTYVMLLMIGTITPTADTQLGTIGLLQSIFDSAGQPRTVLLGHIPLDTPVTLRANRLNMIILRLLMA